MEGIVASLEGLSPEELATRLAQQYSQAVRQDQERRSSEVPPAYTAEGPRLPMSSSSADRGASLEEPSPKLGRTVLHEILGPLRDSVCEDYHTHLRDYRAPRTAVQRLLHLLTAVDPPPDFLVTASYLLYREGLERFCPDRETGGTA